MIKKLKSRLQELFVNDKFIVINKRPREESIPDPNLKSPSRRMKVAIITDTHFGGRRGSKPFHDFFEKFYNDVFFPTLEEYWDQTLHPYGRCF